MSKVHHSESAGGVVLNQQGEVLVVSQHGTSWSLPKGIIEKGEDKLAAAKREIWEEAGVSDLECIKELGTYERFKIGKYGGEDQTEHKIISIFLFRTKQQKLESHDSENPEARWVHQDDVAELLTHPKDKEFYSSVMNEF